MRKKRHIDISELRRYMDPRRVMTAKKLDESLRRLTASYTKPSQKGYTRKIQKKPNVYQRLRVVDVGKRLTGSVMFIIGVILLASSQSGITGNMISERAGAVGSIISLILIVAGILLAIEYHETPEHLYMYVIPKSLEEGISLRGWDPDDLSVAAFDPSKKDPRLVKKLMHIGEDRILVEINDDFLRFFDPRPTGPQNKPQGIYVAKRFIPNTAMSLLKKEKEENKSKSSD